MSLLVEKLADLTDLSMALGIRSQVFVVEQQVPSEIECDQYEQVSSHFLAKLAGHPVGTARWRITSEGVKLERFAVLPEARGKGVGTALVEAVLMDVRSDPRSGDKLIYLNAQLAAIPLYLKLGFKKVGDIFEECNILHSRMELIKF